MGGENIRRRHDLQRRIKFEFFLHDFAANALQREKGRMAFVHMENFRIDPERFERFYTANAEHDFLPHPHFLVTAIKLGGDEPIFGIVFWNVGVEQKQIDSADWQLPDFGKHFAVQNSD